MRRNQILYMVLLISSLILVSYHGGMISYTLFYLCLCIPLASLTYIFYVYKRLQFYQHTPSKIVEKGEILPYEVVFRNEDFIPFTHVKVKFYSEQCKVEESHKVTEYYLLPGDEKKLHTTLRCFYRGDYNVGVKEIEIMDFLYLFKLTYPVMWGLELSVLPKVIHLKNLNILSTQEDPKVHYANVSENMILENDIRRYQPGDSLKHIHWKAVARQREFLTRQVSSEVKRNYIILMDRTNVEVEGYSKLAVEDKIIEIMLAITYYLQSTKVGVSIGYEDNGLQEYDILNDEVFGRFYQSSGQIHFNGNQSLAIVLEQYMMKHPKLNFYILVTHMLTEHLYDGIVTALAKGQQIVLLYVIKEPVENDHPLIYKLGAIGVKVYCISPETSLEELIG
ncbi:MAG: DUF58 domain-containing protein [Cellulosilyticum sp.]|nr:DUF58 domain-containing protein [Cellulosilyticum sp.]